jgi:hypothetical protein
MKISLSQSFYIYILIDSNIIISNLYLSLWLPILNSSIKKKKCLSTNNINSGKKIHPIFMISLYLML